MPETDDEIIGLSRRTVLLGTGASLIVTPLGAAPAPAGSVEDLRGECFVDAAERRKLAASAPVYVGDVVATGDESRLGLALGTRTRIRLGSNSKLKIDKYLPDLGGELVLDQGTLRAKHQPGGNSGLSVRSPFGLMVVRGTEFFVGPTDGVFGVLVESGVVSVSGGRLTVNLTAGQGTFIRRPGRPPTEPRKWAAARVRRARALTD
jgi:hypothetical protein